MSLQITEKIQGTFAHPGENFVTRTESKVFYQLGGEKQLKDAPPPLPPLRNKPLFLFIISKDSKAFITPSPWTAKIARKLPRSYLPPRHGLLPGAWLPRRWSTHAANWSAVLWVTIQQKDLGIFYSIDYMKNHYSTLEITVSFLSLSLLSWKGKIFICAHVIYVVLRDPLQKRQCPKWQLLFWTPGASWWNMLSESWWILSSPCLCSVSLGTVSVVLEEEGRGKGEGLRNNLSSIPPSIQQAAGSNWVRTWSTRTVSD